MDLVITFISFLVFFISDACAELCYEYKNSNTRAFECSDGCCGTNTDAYCCMSPILIVGIVIGSLAGVIIIGVIVFICYQKYRQRKFNMVQKISITNLDAGADKTKASHDPAKHAKGGTMTTGHGHYSNNGIPPTNNGLVGYNNHKNPAFPPLPQPPQPVPRTGTWLFKTNNTGTTQDPNIMNTRQLPPPPPPVNPWLQQTSTDTTTNGTAQPSGEPKTTLFKIPVVDSLPDHPGAAELYVDRAPIKPLPGSLPPLPPLTSNK